MITSKQIISLAEDWDKSFSKNGSNVNIFINPGSSDVLKIVKEVRGKDIPVRYVADAKSKEVYAWNANAAIHFDTVPHINSSYNRKGEDPYIIFGYGYTSGSKIISFTENLSNVAMFVDELASSNSRDSNKTLMETRISRLNKMFQYNWSFLDNYISGMYHFINEQKLKYESWLRRNL
jgi:hypothetical protein